MQDFKYKIRIITNGAGPGGRTLGVQQNWGMRKMIWFEDPAGLVSWLRDHDEIIVSNARDQEFYNG